MKSTPQRPQPKTRATVKAAPAACKRTTRTLTEAQQATMNRAQTFIGYSIIALSVVGAVVLCAMGQLPVPVAVGLILLAVFRLVALKKEMKREAAQQA